jgi:C1A family cysteine protease
MKFLAIFSFFSYFWTTTNASFLERFELWVERFAMKFETELEFHNMFQTWLSNDKFIEQHNAKNLSFELGHNQFSGLNSAQFSEFLGFSGVNLNTGFTKLEPSVVDVSALPASVDWVEKGAVTHVKDQGQCGSCWSFSTTGALEGAYFTKYGSLQSFSEQQLVDCDTFKNGGKDHGCKGGIMDNAFAWIQKNGGLCSEMDYPYVSGDTKTGGTCQTSCKVNKKSTVSDFIDVAPSSDPDMMMALSKQPVAIALEADQREFQLYKSGVFTSACGVNLDHGVLAVGYGTLKGDDYYLVKNSWSESWGANGYILLGRGPQYNKGDGQCGMLLQASYPLV